MTHRDAPAMTHFRFPDGSHIWLISRATHTGIEPALLFPDEVPPICSFVTPAATFDLPAIAIN